jgi:hypothetical protein
MTTTTEPAPPMPGTVWVLEFNAPVPPLSANDRRRAIAKAPDIKQWRHAISVAARQQRLPVGQVERIRLDIELRFADRPDRPIPDREASNHNGGATGKALLDGLTPSKPIRKRPFPGAKVATIGQTVGYGLIPDDKDRNVDGPYLTIGEPLEWWPACPSATVRVTITVLEPLPAPVRRARTRAAR